LKTLIQDHFNLSSLEIKRLPGYENCNYLIKSSLSKTIFKTYNYNKELLLILEAENETLLYLQEKNAKKFPKPIPFASGEYLKVLDIKGDATICRMLSFLDGDFLGDQKITPELCSSFGVFLAEMDLKLQNFSSQTLKARQWEWDLQYFH
jgi:Ser/Thr protein kinase RdoA (MazF antagonist)